MWTYAPNFCEHLYRCIQSYPCASTLELSIFPVPTDSEAKFWSNKPCRHSLATTSLRETKTSWPTLHPFQPGNTAQERGNNPRSPPLIIRKIIRDRNHGSSLANHTTTHSPWKQTPSGNAASKNQPRESGTRFQTTRRPASRAPATRHRTVVITAGAKNPPSRAPSKRAP